jgi:hypothetical protein
MRLPSPPVRMLSNNLPQAGVICTLQMYRVFGQIAMGLAHIWGAMPIMGVNRAPGKKPGAHIIDPGLAIISHRLIYSIVSWPTIGGKWRNYAKT